MKLPVFALLLTVAFFAQFSGLSSLTASGSEVASSGDRSGSSASNHKEKILRLPIRAYVKTADPVRCQTKYENQIISMMYETLVQYKYLDRPLALEPLLLEKMPEISEDGTVYTFTLKKGVRFHDDKCFKDGKGRELRPEDVFYSWKRMADNSNLPKGWWLFEQTIKGFDEYREAQNAARVSGGEFDYDAPVSGMRVLDDRRFEVELNEPVTRFRWILAMPQTSIVPREAVEFHKRKFPLNPVGTGPFTLKSEDWIPNLRLTLHRNPTYHECFYPDAHEEDDEKLGLHTPAGTKLPIADRVELRLFGQDQPMWLKFRTRQIDYTEVPSEYYRKAFVKRTRKLRPQVRAEGISGRDVPLLDFIFRGFNMEDDVVGGYSEKQKNLRRAISLATDIDEFNDTFYHGINIVYDGPIPPGLEGFPENGVAPQSYRGLNLSRAKECLAKAGYPDGKGLPPIKYHTSKITINKEMAEMFRRQMSKINVEIDVQLVDFPTLMQVVDTGRAQMFGFAWGSDYPDAENNLALFYGPNQPPGSNHFRYKNEEYDKLYEQIRSMQPSPERTKIYERMRDMLLSDVPYIGSMARTRHFINNPRLKNFKATEDFYNWVKYLDVDDSATEAQAK